MEHGGVERRSNSQLRSCCSYERLMFQHNPIAPQTTKDPAPIKTIKDQFPESWWLELNASNKWPFKYRKERILRRENVTMSHLHSCCKISCHKIDGLISSTLYLYSKLRADNCIHRFHECSSTTSATKMLPESHHPARTSAFAHCSGRWLKHTK